MFHIAAPVDNSPFGWTSQSRDARRRVGWKPAKYVIRRPRGVVKVIGKNRRNAVIPSLVGRPHREAVHGRSQLLLRSRDPGWPAPRIRAQIRRSTTLLCPGAEKSRARRYLVRPSALLIGVGCFATPNAATMRWPRGPVVVRLGDRTVGGSRRIAVGGPAPLLPGGAKGPVLCHWGASCPVERTLRDQLGSCPRKFRDHGGLVRSGVVMFICSSIC
jgi:hypothetical protein